LPAITTVHNEEKFYRPVQYLGFEFNGKNVLIRPSSLSRFFWKLNYRLQRTVIMAYSPKSKSNQIFLRQIYERYTHLGERNFLTYAYNAASEFYETADHISMSGLNSYAIKKQLRNHWAILRHELGSKNLKWYSHKLDGKKKVNPKYFK
jgi:RNA-directed DNA polymerase